MRFNPDATVWVAKQRILCTLNQSLKDVLNYGLFQPASNGRDGKFLDEERLLREYPQPISKGVPSLEVIPTKLLFKFARIFTPRFSVFFSVKHSHSVVAWTEWGPSLSYLCQSEPLWHRERRYIRHSSVEGTEVAHVQQCFSAPRFLWCPWIFSSFFFICSWKCKQ